MGKQPKHIHAEAFCLMRYQSKDGRIAEWLWNSRDGATPFSIYSKDGLTELFHVEWHRDKYRPDHKPQKGDRIFIDLTIEKARDYTSQRCEEYWNNRDPVSTQFESKAQAIDFFSAEMLHRGAPDILTVE